MNIVQFEYRAHQAGHLFWRAAEYADTYEERVKMLGLWRIFYALGEIAALAAPDEIEAAAERAWSGSEDR